MKPVLTRYFAVVAAIAALLGPISLAQAQTDERLELLRGGASKKGVYNIFGLDGTGLGRTTVSYQTKYPPGTIVIDTSARQLFLIEGNGSALRYGIGVGREAAERHAERRTRRALTRSPAAPDVSEA